jgi:hypothetical protein
VDMFTHEHWPSGLPVRVLEDDGQAATLEDEFGDVWLAPSFEVRQLPDPLDRDVAAGQSHQRQSALRMRRRRSGAKGRERWSPIPLPRPALPAVRTRPAYTGHTHEEDVMRVTVSTADPDVVTPAAIREALEAANFYVETVIVNGAAEEEASSIIWQDTGSGPGMVRRLADR